ncbi:MAG: hypothetical protein R6V28_05765 [Nitriliruptoraceae bacterium]
MGEGPADRYPRGWVAAGAPPRGARWAARHPVVFALLLGAVIALVVAAVASLLLAPVPAAAVGVGVGVALGGGSLIAQRDLRALLARWDEEHRSD